LEAIALERGEERQRGQRREIEELPGIKLSEVGEGDGRWQIRGPVDLEATEVGEEREGGMAIKIVEGGNFWRKDEERRAM
jgi:hypothetical protein